MKQPKKLLVSALVCLLLAASVAPARAWFNNDKKKAEKAAVEKVQTFQPPNPDANNLYCEPYRLEAVALSKKPKVMQGLLVVRKNWLISQHRKCLSNLMEQEHQYLKHVDVEQSPSLPRLTTPAAAAPVAPDAPASPASSAAPDTHGP